MADRRFSAIFAVEWKEDVRLRLQIAEQLLDPRNVQLLKLLGENPRMSISALARRIGLSAPAVRQRIQRLEDAGVIKGYRLEIDAAALGYPISAFVRVRPMPGALPKIRALAQRLPQVTECYRITGEDCFILKVHLDKLDNIDHILDQFLAFGQTTTSLVQSAPVPPRGLPFPGDA
jgi:Lrp/AsnC family leucine-responsive transcriptional regulator